MAFDACKSAIDLAVPYILIQGRDDHVTPPTPRWHMAGMCAPPTRRRW